MSLLAVLFSSLSCFFWSKVCNFLSWSYLTFSMYFDVTILNLSLCKYASSKLSLNLMCQFHLPVVYVNLLAISCFLIFHLLWGSIYGTNYNGIYGTNYSGLVVKVLDSQSRGPVFKTSGWLQGLLSLSSFRGR